MTTNDNDARFPENGNRRGLTLVELLVAGFTLIVVIGLMLPGFLKAREASRKTRCQNNLKRIGLGLHNYHDAHRVLPPGALSWGKLPRMHFTAHTIVPLFIECCSTRYNHELSWNQQTADARSGWTGDYICPGQAGGRTTEDEFLGSQGRAVGTTFGVASYVYCKGVGDAWCRTPESTPARERGAFDVDLWIRMTDVVDGLSHTIFVGEGATGKPWHVCAGVGCTQAVRDPATKNRWLPHQPWIAAHINTAADISVAGPRASQFASTMEPMNKNPVTDTFIDSTALNDCRSSADGGPHRTSNFRSSHADGAFFLFGDGSVKFLDEEIDMKLYRGLSTIAGGEDVGGL